MWVVAGALLGATLLAALVGLHTGPHTHAAAAALGVVAAGWLAAMAATGRGSGLLYLLLGADLAVSSGIAVGAWRALRPGVRLGHPPGPGQLEGSEGVAVGDLSPDGVVRVKGEEWSARALNGPIAAGSRVQVIGADGVRLEVWGDEAKGAT